MNGWIRKLGLATGLAVLGVGAADVAPAGAIAPTVPLGCQQLTTNFANTTPLAIPDLTVVSQDIVVAGVVGPIWDVDVITNLTHTTNTDIEMTVRSPGGTIVTLTTDNGGFLTNVFNGTRWDDQAQDPVVDHTYTQLVPEPTLSPEEPLSAFGGEDPNGVWTITIVDDEAIDDGTLNGWSLDITTFGGPLVTYQAVVIDPTDVPISDLSTISRSVEILGLPQVVDVDVLTNVAHTFPSDLDMTLTSPDGVEVTLTSDNGDTFDNAFAPAIWDDDANPAGLVPYTINPGLVTDHPYATTTPVGFVTPEEPLGAFRSANAIGTWTLTITDDFPGDAGTLLEFGLQVTTGTCSPPPDLPPAPAPLPEPEPVPPTLRDVDVLASENRVGTAIKVSQASFGQDEASAVVVARRDDFPDALAGTPLAAAEGGPLLLSSTGALESEVEEEIARVLPAGGDIYLLGGTSALGPNVGSRLAGLGYAVHRLAGENRYETAVEIAEALGSPQTVLEASGLDFPDAVSAGAAAIKEGAAVLLTNGASQSAATAGYLAANPGATRFAVGGPAASADPSANRLVGENRFETSALVATRFFPTPTVAGVASGRSFPDALTGGVHIGGLGGPMLLTEPGDLPAPITDFLDANFESISQVFVYGGSTAVGAPVIEEITEAIA